MGDPDSSCLNEYIREVGFDLEASFVVEVGWWKVEEEWVFDIFTCPETGEWYLLGPPTYGIHSRLEAGQKQRTLTSFTGHLTSCYKCSRICYTSS